MQFAPNTALWEISDELAEKQLKRDLKIAWIAAIVTFFLFGFASFIAIGFGIRCVVLSWRKVNASKPNGLKLKISSVAVTVLGAIDLASYYAISHRL